MPNNLRLCLVHCYMAGEFADDRIVPDERWTVAWTDHSREVAS